MTDEITELSQFMCGIPDAFDLTSSEEEDLYERTEWSDEQQSEMDQIQSTYESESIYIYLKDVLLQFGFI